MTCRAFFGLCLLSLALASSPIPADAATPEAAAPAAAEDAVASPEASRADAAVRDLLPTSLLDFLGAAPQGGFRGCPFEDVFSVEAPPDWVDCQATCADLCAQNGGTLIFGSTTTGADCTCACCRS
jgi:hypothetical protein